MNNTSMALLALAGIAAWFALTEHQKRTWSNENRYGVADPSPVDQNTLEYLWGGA